MEEHPEARSIVETLAKAGFVAYYAGGWVRDFLLRHPSDDIDIATNAPPETIQALFPHTVPIGIAFGIILVIVNGRQYEVATFRQDHDYKDGRRPSRVEFSTAIEDARRRDFTINGMFYDPLKEEVLDFVNGKNDLEAKIIRAIGDPHARIKEDRLRMLRAARLSCRFGFPIEPATEKAIIAHAKELFPAVAVERIWQEFQKGYDFGKLCPMLEMLFQFGLLQEIFPALQGLSQADIEKRLKPVEKYPKEAPLIASILALFPGASLDEQLQLCKKFKLSNLDQKFIFFLWQVKDLLKQKGELHEWAHIYANDFAAVCLKILDIFHEHEKRIASLKVSIGRIKRNDPVIKAEDLMKEGIVPGKTMGLLLKEAEKISINEQIFQKGPILDKLKRLSLWK